MKILHVILSDKDGASAMAYNHALALRAFDGEVAQHFVTAAKSGLNAKLAELGIPALHAPRTSSSYNYKTACRLHDAIARVQPDCVLSHGIAATFNTAAALVSKRNTITHIAVMHYPKATGMNGRVHGVIAVSDAMRARALKSKIGEDRIAVVPNFVAEDIPALSAAARVKNPFVIGFLGRVEGGKGMDIFLAAMRKLHARGVDFRAMVGGNGREMDKYRAMAADAGIGRKVEWLGWVEDKKEFFRGVDILVVPSKIEAFGLIIPEAWAQGVPVVATRAEGPACLIAHGKTGLLAGDAPMRWNITPEEQDRVAADIGDHVERLVADKALYARLRRAGHKEAFKYHIDAVGPQVGEAVRRLVRSGQGLKIG